MRDTWRCRWYPGGLPVGVIRDTWRNRSMPGKSTRETRVAFGGFRGNNIRETRGALGGFREGPIGLGNRDTWRTRTASGVIYWLGYSGHVGYPGCSRSDYRLGSPGRAFLADRLNIKG